MKNTKNFEDWRAEEIAKVYLLNSGLITLLPDYENKFDFIAISKASPEKRFAIEVKATKIPTSDIPKVLPREGNLFDDSKFPVLRMYIDHDKEKGYYEIINRSKRAEIQPIQSKEFDTKLKELTQ